MATRLFFLILLLAICYLPLTIEPSAVAFDRTNIPIKNWGGLSVNRGWVYDGLERLVLAGLADQVLLNTKPLSRVAAARIVAQAVDRIKTDLSGDYNHRGYLEEILYQLVGELGHELSEMKVRTPLNTEVLPGVFDIKPVKHWQMRNVFSDESRKLSNGFGQEISDGANVSSTLEGSLQVGDYLSFYYQPEFTTNWDSYHGRLINGYGKLTFWNTEILVGRDTLWWGPGYRGSMTFSNNGFPLDQVRVSSAEPFRLPWLLKYLGPMNLTGFAAQLEEDRAVPEAKVGGWRINLAPFHFMELGFSRAFQFGGEGRGRLDAGDFIRLMVGQGSDDSDSPLNVNNVMSLDVTFRFPNAERYIWIARDFSIYGELGWDDTTDPGFQFLSLPTGSIIPRKPGGIIGFLLSGFMGDPKLDFRFELAKTTDIQFTHSIYKSGFTNRGSVLSHFIGTDGSEIYTRISRWFNPNILLGTEISLAQIGSPDGRLRGAPREKRNSFSFDLSYRISDHSSIFMKYDILHVQNRNFVTHDSEIDNLFRIEFTRSFGW